MSGQAPEFLLIKEEDGKWKLPHKKISPLDERRKAIKEIAKKIGKTFIIRMWIGDISYNGANHRIELVETRDEGGDWFFFDKLPPKEEMDEFSGKAIATAIGPYMLLYGIGQMDAY